ncbi:hypothetical protein AB0C21_21950 [Spirillospora sp. NPDC049024]
MPLREVEITDIRSADQLISYATLANLAWLMRHHGVSQGAVARALSIKPPNFSTLLNGKLEDRHLQELDEVIVGIAPELDRTGGLSSLAVRLRGLTGRTSLAAKIPPTWTSKLLDTPLDSEIAVLTHASALLSTFWAVQNTGHVNEVRSRYREQIKRLVAKLILIGAAPPTPRNIDALVLLGSLAGFAFDEMEDVLERELHEMPLGFRVWRTITKLVKISKDSPIADELSVWVAQMLEDAEELRERSVYPGRSLDLEMIISLPAPWTVPNAATIQRLLLTRARNTRATVRERGTATLGLWERTLDGRGHSRDEVEGELQQMINDFENEAEHPEAATGLRWVAATLRYLMQHELPVCNDLRAIDDPCQVVVQDATDYLRKQNLPSNIQNATITLFVHALLQNAGVHRRQAIDTLLTGGWAQPVTRALDKVLKHSKAESWLRCRALFALGFLQHRDSGVERTLTTHTNRLHERLKSDGPTLPLVSETHAALFAIGDCFGAVGAEAKAKQIRTALEPTLRDLAEKTESSFYPVARALVYLLTVTAQPRLVDTPAEADLSEQLLARLHEHPDPVTRKFSDWTLGFRFAPNGDIRPFYDAAA